MPAQAEMIDYGLRGSFLYSRLTVRILPNTMKNIHFTLEFVSPCLALGRAAGDDVDTFWRDGEGNLLWKSAWWRSAFVQALKYLNASRLKANQIKVCLVVDAPTETYRRRINDDCVRVHEAISCGEPIAFEAIIDDSIETEEFQAVLAYIGKFIGLSPFGHNLGFGRFEVIDVQAVPSVSV